MTISAHTVTPDRDAPHRTVTLASQPGGGLWWGPSFQAIQPKNPVFWVFLTLIVGGALFLINEYAALPTLFRTVEIVSLVLIVLIGALFVWLARAMDVFRAVPVSLAICAFLWGAFPANNLIAIQANDAFVSIYAKLFGGQWASDWATGLTAGFDEEFAKGLGFIVLFALARNVIVRPLQAFIVGAFIGLGFQFVENFSYAVNSAIGAQFGANAVELGVIVLLQRFAEGLSSHSAYSAVFACGLFLLMRSSAKIAGVACIAFGVAGHFAWDNSGVIFAGWVGAIPVLTLIIAGTTFLVWIYARRIEYRSAEEAATESFADMPAQLLHAVAGSRRTRRRFIRRGGERRHRAVVARRRLVRAGRYALLSAHRSGRRSAGRRDAFSTLWANGEQAR